MHANAYYTPIGPTGLLCLTPNRKNGMQLTQLRLFILIVLTIITFAASCFVYGVIVLKVLLVLVLTSLVLRMLWEVCGDITR
jgi:hypothetical protein